MISSKNATFFYFGGFTPLQIFWRHRGVQRRHFGVITPLLATLTRTGAAYRRALALTILLRLRDVCATLHIYLEWNNILDGFWIVFIMSYYKKIYTLACLKFNILNVQLKSQKWILKSNSRISFFSRELWPKPKPSYEFWGKLKCVCLKI